MISIIDNKYEKGSFLKETECSGETYHHWSKHGTNWLQNPDPYHRHEIDIH